MMNCVDLPTVLVAKILEFVDHDTLYQAEMTSSFFLHTIRELSKL
jgi:hypothetical protein